MAAAAREKDIDDEQRHQERERAAHENTRRKSAGSRAAHGMKQFEDADEREKGADAQQWFRGIPQRRGKRQKTDDGDDRRQRGGSRAICRPIERGCASGRG